MNTAYDVARDFDQTFDQTNDRFIYEPITQGVHATVRKRGLEVRVLIDGRDDTHAHPAIVAAVRALPVQRVTLAGEIVDGDVVDGNRGTAFVALDCLRLDGNDMRSEPLLQRKWTLDFVLVENRSRALRSLEWLDGKVMTGAAALARFAREGAHGVVAKRKDARWLARSVQRDPVMLATQHRRIS